QACARELSRGTPINPRHGRAHMKERSMAVSADLEDSFAPATRLVVGGRDPATNHGFVNPPVQHASTVLYPTAEDFLARRARYLYGRRGTTASAALVTALRGVEVDHVA